MHIKQFKWQHVCQNKLLLAVIELQLSEKLSIFQTVFSIINILTDEKNIFNSISQHLIFSLRKF